ncbi:carboxypeptidase-like regulatory domain-containing protein [Formosa algae]|uniref:Carboxypeptidase-like regulatory domain-containing protein n=1 Tax=Formosa algae TaxID=225843 RepID=A0A9X1CCY4_9FLAO|nr:carboxypeptidase-like regulatory domain-containing protein [Formosa algae]MBP1840770.1 hypothetical protein [Formosa algae]MDQ0336333.1 hypothetical protein [Formosa algae]PNW28726.1 hypothetical protein BKP44_07365 [Formosa algae]
MKIYFLILYPLVLFSMLKGEIISETRIKTIPFELKQEKDSLIIYGKVNDNIGELFEYVTVKIQNSKTKSTVNKYGEYRINVTEQLNKNKKIVIEFYFLGYKTERREIKKKLFKKNNILEMNIKMKEEVTIIECPNG